MSQGKRNNHCRRPHDRNHQAGEGPAVMPVDPREERDFQGRRRQVDALLERFPKLQRGYGRVFGDVDDPGARGKGSDGQNKPRQAGQGPDESNAMPRAPARLLRSDPRRLVAAGRLKLLQTEERRDFLLFSALTSNKISSLGEVDGESPSTRTGE